MRFCSKCNCAIKEGESFCSNCGARVEEEKNDYNDGYADDNFDEEPIDFSAVHNFGKGADADNNIYSHSAQSMNAHTEQRSTQPNTVNTAKSGANEPYIRKVCPNCNQPLNRGQSVCPYCGYDVSRYNDGYDSPIVDEYTPAPSPFIPAQVKKKKKNGNGAVIATAVIAAIVVVAAIVFIFMFMGNKNGNNAPTSPSAATEATQKQTETQAETDAPTEEPTAPPTEPPTEPPTDAPTVTETEAPTDAPTEAPTMPETDAPTELQSDISEPLAIV